MQSLTTSIVTDRLAYLQFVHGTLAANLSQKLNTSRVALKNIRDAESALLPRRNIRAGITLQINRIKNDGQKGAAVERRVAELQESLRKAEAEDEDLEKQFEITKRKFLKENEELKWASIREVSICQISVRTSFDYIFLTVRRETRSLVSSCRFIHQCLTDDSTNQGCTVPRSRCNCIHKGCLATCA